MSLFGRLLQWSWFCRVSQSHTGLVALQISEEKVSRVAGEILKWHSAIQKDEEKGTF